jgi:hypothetical protein
MTNPSNVIDFSRYLPPGVYMNPKPGPQLAVNSSQPTAVGIIGQTHGLPRPSFRPFRCQPDTNDTTASLSSDPGLSGHQHRHRRWSPTPTAERPMCSTPTTPCVNVGAPSGTANALYAIERVIDGGHIDPGDYIQVSYQYTDPDYYTPYIFYDYNDVKTAYGHPFNLTTGAIQSEPDADGQVRLRERGLPGGVCGSEVLDHTGQCHRGRLQQRPGQAPTKLVAVVVGTDRCSSPCSNSSRSMWISSRPTALNAEPS